MPCSRRARADANARVPAPPVMTALPGQAKRATARSAADKDDGKEGKGAVRGDLVVDNVIVGMRRAERSARASRIAEASPILLDMWPSRTMNRRKCEVLVEVKIRPQQL